VGGAVVIRAVLGAGVFAGLLWGMNALYMPRLPGAYRNAELVQEAGDEGVWVIIGSSNVRAALDANLLDSLDAGNGRQWFNVAEPGLAGEALLSEALAFVEAPQATALEGLCVELIGSPLHAPPVDRRTARWVPWWTAVEAHAEAVANVFDSAGVWRHGKRLVEHGILRSTSGLHAWLHPEAAEPAEEGGGGRGGTTAVAVWNGAPDSLRQLRIAEEAATLRAFERGTGYPVTSVFPLKQLRRLRDACAARQVELVVCVQPASGQAGWVGPVAGLLGAPPVLLDGGKRPTPFVTTALLADPVHVNRTGARQVTAAFYAELRRRQILH